VTFASESFVNACRDAVSDADPTGAIADVVAEAISHGSLIDDALGTEVTLEPLTLFSSTEVTVQRIVWPRGAVSSVHDHQMWAVVGVYAGCEVNRRFRRSPDGLVELTARDVPQGEVLVLDADAVHSAANTGREWTAGLHVYGGDILGAARRAWDPGGHERPYAEVVQARLTIIQAMRDFASERGSSFTDDDRVEAMKALWAECERQGRHLTAAEARDIAAASWTGRSA
jgi:predicted metal-dependent enzyme (double-stranded beta helix superfamily)